jgi:hypothetical protein
MNSRPYMQAIDNGVDLRQCADALESELLRRHALDLASEHERAIRLDPQLARMKLRAEQRLAA